MEDVNYYLKTLKKASFNQYFYLHELFIVFKFKTKLIHQKVVPLV